MNAPWEFKKQVMSNKDLDPDCLVARLLPQPEPEVQEEESLDDLAKRLIEEGPTPLWQLMYDAALSAPTHPDSFQADIARQEAARLDALVQWLYKSPPPEFFDFLEECGREDPGIISMDMMNWVRTILKEQSKIAFTFEQK